MWNYSSKFYFAQPQGKIVVSLFSNAMFGSDAEIGHIDLDLASRVADIENAEREEEFTLDSDPSITVQKWLVLGG